MFDDQAGVARLLARDDLRDDHRRAGQGLHQRMVVGQPELPVPFMTPEPRIQQRDLQRLQRPHWLDLPDEATPFVTHDVHR